MNTNKTAEQIEAPTPEELSSIPRIEDLDPEMQVLFRDAIARSKKCAFVVEDDGTED
jgi:hypothetical protein